MVQITMKLSNTMEVAKTQSALASMASYFIDIPARVAEEIGKKLEEELPKALIPRGVRAIVRSCPGVEDGEASVTLTIEVQNALELVEQQILEHLPGELQKALKQEGIEARITQDNGSLDNEQ
jgi:hypothetical protein